MNHAKKITSIYDELRNNDKARVGSIPLKDRLILSQLITNSPADKALRFAWANRSLAQACLSNSSAVLALGDAPEADLLARRASLMMRKKLGLVSPCEINNQGDLTEFLNRTNVSRLVIKQNYPCDNEEFFRAINFNFGKSKLEIANRKIDYDVIESKICLANVALKSESWMKHETERYLRFIVKKNNINLSEQELMDSAGIMKSLVSKVLIPTKIFKGSVDDLVVEVRVLIAENFLPVFKFPYSVSGFGVHYPKNLDGSYNISELKRALSSGGEFIGYLTDALNKNGQIVDQASLAHNISHYGITLQKHIYGHEHSVGYFKPLPSQASSFCLGLSDLVLTDVLVEGTGHSGNVLHYDTSYLHRILRNTPFNNQPNLLHFSIELILYLMYLDQKRIDNPEDFERVCVEDFGIQFIVNDAMGEIGLIEFNGRTPSCNLNHFYLLSKYDLDSEDATILPSKSVLFTNAKIMSASKFCGMKDRLESFITNLIKNTSDKLGDKCELVALQTSDGDLTVNFAYFLDHHKGQKLGSCLENIKKFFLHSIDITNNNQEKIGYSQVYRKRTQRY